MWFFGDYISEGTLDIKQLAEEDPEAFRSTFHNFVFKERIHKMGNGKEIVFVVNSIMNNFLVSLSLLGIIE